MSAKPNFVAVHQKVAEIFHSEPINHHQQKMNFLPLELAKYNTANIKNRIGATNCPFMFLHYRGPTWRWLLSPSPTCVKRSLIFPSPSWAWASASCTANPTPPTTDSSPSWTPWLPTSGSTSSWPTWELAVSFLSLPGKYKSYKLFVLSALHTFSMRSFNRHSNLHQPASHTVFAHWVVIKAVKSALALYSPAVGGGIVAKFSEQILVSCVMSLKNGNRALDGAPFKKVV